MTRAEELQHSTTEEFWARFAAVMGGPDGLMTYRYLGSRADPEEEDTSLMPLRRDMRNPAGGLMAAPIAIAIADAGGMKSDAGGVPAPITSAVHLLDAGNGVTTVKARAFSIHRGRSVGFTQGELVDADQPERILAITTGTGVNLGEAPPGYAYVDPGPRIPDSPNLPPLHEAFGATRRPDGQWELPELSQSIGSTSGSLHHGPIQVTLEAAAMELATEAAGTDQLQIEDWSVMYMQRGKIGPFVVSGRAVPGHDRVGVHLALHDAGNGDRLTTTALGVFHRV